MRPGRSGSRPAIVVIRRPRRVKGLQVVQRLSPTGPGFLTLERSLVRNVYLDGPSGERLSLTIQATVKP